MKESYIESIKRFADSLYQLAFESEECKTRLDLTDNLAMTEWSKVTAVRRRTINEKTGGTTNVALQFFH